MRKRRGFEQTTSYLYHSIIMLNFIYVLINISDRNITLTDTIIFSFDYFRLYTIQDILFIISTIIFVGLLVELKSNKVKKSLLAVSTSLIVFNILRILVQIVNSARVIKVIYQIIVLKPEYISESNIQFVLITLSLRILLLLLIAIVSCSILYMANIQLTLGKNAALAKLKTVRTINVLILIAVVIIILFQIAHGDYKNGGILHAFSRILEVIAYTRTVRWITLGDNKLY